jgi:TatD DNase family protein
LAEQLEMARGFELPAVVHAREAMDDCVASLSRHGFDGRRVVFHCFTGTAEEARKIADHGWRVSFTGVVTFKNSAEIAAIAQAYPVDQLMLETDSPYLSPAPVRNVRPNEPAHLAHTARFLAELRGVSVQELALQTSENARRFFQLPPVGG